MNTCRRYLLVLELGLMILGYFGLVLSWHLVRESYLAFAGPAARLPPRMVWSFHVEAVSSLCFILAHLLWKKRALFVYYCCFLALAILWLLIVFLGAMLIFFPAPLQPLRWL